MSKYSCWTPKQKRCFSRLRLVFLHNFFYKKQKVRFLTLTSAPGSPDVHDSFRKLIKRLRYLYGSFEYFAVRTSEGYGVYHIVFTGCYVPKKVLRGMWYDIHGAYMVNVQWVRGTPMNVSRYLVNQYMSGQYGFERYSWSWHLVFSGFVSCWRKLLFLTGFDFRLADYFFMFGRLYLKQKRVIFVVVKGKWRCVNMKWRDLYGNDWFDIKDMESWREKIERKKLFNTECQVCRERKTGVKCYNGEWVCQECYNKY